MGGCGAGCIAMGQAWRPSEGGSIKSSQCGESAGMQLVQGLRFALRLHQYLIRPRLLQGKSSSSCCGKA